MIKKIILLFILGLAANQSFAQKFGYVDTDFILNKMPEYKKAQQQIDELSTEWREDIQEKYKEIESMYNQLQAEEVLLTVEMKDERRATIQQKEEEVKEYQKKVFGYNGLFFLKKQELIKPVQDKIFEAVEKIANDHRLQVVFDKSGDLVMIYTNPMHDYTDFVLEELGLGDENDVVK
mgnify:CR=1 FL=1